MEWQFDNSMPIYTQLINKIELAIVSGEYVRGQRLPAVRDLASEAGIGFSREEIIKLLESSEKEEKENGGSI